MEHERVGLWGAEIERGKCHVSAVANAKWQRRGWQGALCGCRGGGGEAYMLDHGGGEAQGPMLGCNMHVCIHLNDTCTCLRRILVFSFS